MNPAAVVTGLGTTAPETVVTNEMVARGLDTSDEWIRTRTGIRERRVVTSGTATSDLAVDAGRNALKSAGLDEVGALVLATTTPDHPCPATAPTVAYGLGLGEIPAFDVSAVCSGFLYGLASGAGLIAAGVADTVLVVAAEAFTTIIDPTDRNTAPIFGDGAGAVVLRAGKTSEAGALLGLDLHSNGSMAELIMTPAGGSRQRSSGRVAEPHEHFMGMQGRTVFVNAVMKMEQSSRTALAATGWETGDVDWLIGHQANARILSAVAERLEIPAERAYINLDRYGNTAGASIPLALGGAADEGLLTAGHRVLLTAFGGGATWGAVTLRWPEIVPVV
ncbi:MAG: 3-oxoacyl-ACP synthase [Pseudonocardiales bacterium]|nr:MAG: 3-oxoacyl-ACP synthase [Pseudonocardiales bacterium]